MNSTNASTLILVFLGIELAQILIGVLNNYIVAAKGTTVQDIVLGDDDICASNSCDAIPMFTYAVPAIGLGICIMAICQTISSTKPYRTFAHWMSILFRPISKLLSKIGDIKIK